MDIPDISNLSTLSYCDLNTKFNDRSYADWSKTNIISFVSSDGIYILRPQLERVPGPFGIELIRNPNFRFRHQILKDLVPAFDDFSYNLDNEQYLQVFLDPALTTNVNKLTSDACTRRYRLAKWSPIVNKYPKHCLLGTITTDYHLTIFCETSGAWIVKSDLTLDYERIWAQINSNYYDSQQKLDNNFEQIKEILHSLSFCNFCWLENELGNHLLLAATIPGDIVIWQLQSDKFGNNSYFQITTILKTSQQYVNSMQIHDKLLITASQDGQVTLFDLSYYVDEIEKSFGNDLQSNGASVTSSKTLQVLNLSPTAILWHPDNIEVTDFYLQPSTHDTFKIILAKSTNICWCTIHYMRPSSQQATLAISDSISAIDGLDPDVSLHQTPATWLKPAGNRKAILVADDGSFFQLDFVDDRQDASPAFNAIRTDKIDLTDLVPRGLCVSPNGHLITMISSVSFLFDPIRISSPTKVVLLPTINDKRFFIDCTEKLFDDSWLSSNRITSPVDVHDRLDYIRSVFPQLSHIQLYNFQQNLTNIANKIGYPQSAIQLVKLKIVVFLLSKLVECSSTKMIDGDHKDSTRKEIYDLILLYNIEQIFKKVLFDNEQMQLFSLDQVNSLRNYMNWLNMEPNSKARELRDRYSDKFNRMMAADYKHVPIELCPICQSIINFESLDFGSCQNMHRYARCSRNLLTLDLNKGDEFECEHCRRQYMSTLIWPPISAESLWLCLFCQ